MAFYDDMIYTPCDNTCNMTLMHRSTFFFIIYVLPA